MVSDESTAENMWVLERTGEGKLQEDAGNCIMISYMICTAVQIYEGAKFVEDEMGEACSVRGRDDKCIARISKKPELTVELEIIITMKKIILKGFVNKYGGKVGNGLIWIKT